jgi:hypothetical protein
MVPLHGRSRWPVLTADGALPSFYHGSECGFACRRCYDLPYASQLKTLSRRGLKAARKIRMELGEGPNLLDALPPRPKGMRRSRYDRLCRRYNATAARHGFRLAMTRHSRFMPPASPSAASNAC